jgi:2-polyprenyl-3-methyl-5-hydroxy-6-metoxy-1,4-benzoquinol methylase
MKARIYEKLATASEPANYSGRIPWIVQQQVAATNGIHYVNSIGTLTEYPIPEIPVEPDGKNNLLLDIGCGWGRWLTAASSKNFITVGIDIRLEFCEVARGWCVKMAAMPIRLWRPAAAAFSK